MQNTNSNFLIQDLELYVYLGWPKEERAQKQKITVNLAISLPELPKACASDHLDDTFCYAALIEKVRVETSAKKFHLVEYLAQYIYQLIKPLLPERAKLTVTIEKYPPIQGFSGNIQFNFGDN